MLDYRPFQTKALHDWLIYSGYLPVLLVNPNTPGIILPSIPSQGQSILINICGGSLRNVEFRTDGISFDIAGKDESNPTKCFVPGSAIIGVMPDGQNFCYKVSQQSEMVYNAIKLTPSSRPGVLH